MSVELRHLEHFMAVAEERSFTRAAARLHLVQSTLSVSIRSLERELDGRLFERTTHHVELTDAGWALLTEARNVLASVETARDAVAAAHGGLRGTVRVGIMHSLTLIDLAAVLTRYHQERPHVRIIPSPAQGGSMELVHQVIDGALDLAFAALPADYPPGLTVHPLASEPMRLACPVDHPLARRRVVPLTELDGESFVDAPPGWGTRLSADRILLESGVRRRIAVEVADVPTVVELVRAGFGFAFLSESLTAGTRAVALLPVHPEPVFEISLITAADRHPTAAAQALISLVLATFAPRPNA
ncbi:LysR family transcriptional regulator [Streptomyces sp. TS71-3]|uniref:LysR family transcriptional regulator n=1 Tax=Streptomyces sp. TS71-3 TaxID=2733862 RepID=UPI001B0EC160|nr:LysR family transcriptional regulator [Streptomyces sp. TS71-3]GHJ38469.1 LysR family transcriptional regulator [Streptomyces sp. TS71-3]